MQNPQMQIMAMAAGMDQPQLVEQAAHMRAQMEMQQGPNENNGQGQPANAPPAQGA
jgi:hypothetical protein